MDVLHVCKLTDLSFSGAPFTYDNRRIGQQDDRVRLDRAVADVNWTRHSLVKLDTKNGTSDNRSANSTKSSQSGQATSLQIFRPCGLMPILSTTLARFTSAWEFFRAELG